MPSPSFAARSLKNSVHCDTVPVTSLFSCPAPASPYFSSVVQFRKRSFYFDVPFFRLTFLLFAAFFLFFFVPLHQVL